MEWATVPVTYFPVATQHQLRKNQQRISGKPYARYFRPELRLRAEVLPALERPMSATDALPLRDVNALLDPGYHRVENGFCELRDGSAYVASLVPFSGATGEMYQWWFWWHAVESERYTLWYPHNHVAVRPLDRSVLTAPGLTHEQRYVGTTHHVDEYIGPDFVRVAIRFVDPAELGLDTSRFAAAGIVGHACARVRLIGTPAEVVTMIHLARRTDRGIEQRSRYWIGHDVRLRGFGASLRVGRWPWLTRRLAGERIGYEQFLHDQIEFTHLSEFLPDLWREFGQLAEAPEVRASSSTRAPIGARPR